LSQTQTRAQTETYLTEDVTCMLPSLIFSLMRSLCRCVRVRHLCASLRHVERMVLTNPKGLIATFKVRPRFMRRRYLHVHEHIRTMEMRV
jgi:hypothetical protein